MGTAFETPSPESTTILEGHYYLDAHTHRQHSESLEYYLGHAFTLRLGIPWRVRGHDVTEIIELVVPTLLHVVPVVDDTMCDGMCEGQYSSFVLSPVFNLAVLLVPVDNDARQLTCCRVKLSLGSPQ